MNKSILLFLAFAASAFAGAGKLQTKDTNGNTKWVTPSGDVTAMTDAGAFTISGGGGGGNPFTDATAILKNSSDATKLLRFSLSGITTGTTRVITMPDSNLTLPIISQQLTISGPSTARTITVPDANFTAARTDAANTFTGTQTVGALVATTLNGNTFTTGTFTLTGTAAKTLTFSNTLTLAGTDGTTMTFPSTTATIARTDAANTFTGHQTIEGVTSTGATGTGKFVFDASPTITGHETIEGVTATGATGTGKFVFDTSPTIASPTFTTPTLGTVSSGTWQGTAIGATYGGTGISTASATGYPSLSSGTWSIVSASTLKNALSLNNVENTALSTWTGSTSIVTVGGITASGNETFNGTVTISPSSRSSGTAAYLTITTPADTSQTASTESIGVNFTAATRQWATGALTTQREHVFAAPTYGFVGASTLTTAINVDIADPVAGTNATLTNKYALRAASLDVTGAANLEGTTTAGTINATNCNVTTLAPTTNDGAALGDVTHNFSDLFLATGAVINYNNGNYTLTHSSGLLTASGPFSVGTSNAITAGTIELGHATDTTLSRSSAGVLAVEGVVVDTISATNTLTNKRITPRITTISSSATPTVNTDNCDCVTITAIGTAITSMTSSLSGTPNNFDQLEYRIKDDGTARAITWGTSFSSGTGTLPTTTTLSKVLHVWFEWDSVQSKWVCASTGSEP